MILNELHQCLELIKNSDSQLSLPKYRLYLKIILNKFLNLN